MSAPCPPTPLTVLTEDECAFRDAVAAFANGEVRPRVAAMGRAGQLDPPPPPLPVPTEDECAFRDAVAAFANGEVRPRVAAMERAEQLDPDLLPKYFELGLMGIQVPERYGGAGGTLMMTILA